MRQQTKNALIAFLVGYLIVDFVGVALLSKKTQYVCNYSLETLGTNGMY